MTVRKARKIARKILGVNVDIRRGSVTSYDPTKDVVHLMRNSGLPDLLHELGHMVINLNEGPRKLPLQYLKMMIASGVTDLLIDRGETDAMESFARHLDAGFKEELKAWEYAEAFLLEGLESTNTESFYKRKREALESYTTLFPEDWMGVVPGLKMIHEELKTM